MRAWKYHPHLRHITSPKDSDRRFLANFRARSLSLTIQKPLNIGQKCHKIAVMSFLELPRITRKLVQHLSPRIVWIGRLEKLPMLLDRRILPNGRRLHRLQQDLSEMSNNLLRIRHVTYPHR